MKNFNLMEYSCETILEKMRSIVIKEVAKEDEDLQQVKLINRTVDSAEFLILTKNINIWKCTYEYADTKWENPEIAIVSNRRKKEICELSNVRRNFREVLKYTVEECDEATIKFYEDAPSCEQQEERARKIAEEEEKQRVIKELARGKRRR